jgi:hypothetical protein
MVKYFIHRRAIFKTLHGVTLLYELNQETVKVRVYVRIVHFSYNAENV